MQSNAEVLAALVTEPPNHRRLAGRTALVTNATEPTGEAVARVLASSGARVVVHGRDQGRAMGISTSIMAAGGQAHAVAGDLTSPAPFVRALVPQVRAHLGGSGPDLLVLTPTADLGAPKGVPDLDLEALLNANVRAPQVLVAELVPAMVERGNGAIVLVGEWLAEPARTWAVDLGPRGVRVNSVRPGRAATLRPVDVAYAVRFLASDEAAAIHDTTLPVGVGPSA